MGDCFSQMDKIRWQVVIGPMQQFIVVGWGFLGTPSFKTSTYWRSGFCKIKPRMKFALIFNDKSFLWRLADAMTLETFPAVYKGGCQSWVTQKSSPWFIPSSFNASVKHQRWECKLSSCWVESLGWDKHLLSKSAHVKLRSLAVSLPFCCLGRSRPAIFLDWVTEQSS